MIISKAKVFVVLPAVMFFFSTRLIARTPSDTLKDIHASIAKIIDVDLKDAGVNKAKWDDATKNKIHNLKEALSKVQKDKTVRPLFEDVLKTLGAFKLSGQEKKAIGVSLPDFNIDIASLQSKIKAYEKKGQTGNPSSINSVHGLKNGVIDTGKNKRRGVDTTEISNITSRGNAGTPNISGARARKEDSITISSLRKINSGLAITNTDQEKTIKNNFLYLAIVSAGAIIFFAAILFLYYRQKKANRELLLTNGAILTDYNKLNGAYGDLNAAYQSLMEKKNNAGSPDQGLKQPAQPPYHPPPLMPLMTNLPTTGKYFFGEAMVTAGPRKNFDTDAKVGDYGLGEDVAGFIIQKDKAFFWVLDGTSDSDKLTNPIVTADSQEEEYFSSRLLAQSIGWNLQQLISNRLPHQFNAAQLLQQAIKTTEGEWKKTISKLDKVNHEALLNALLDKNGVLQCSTTAVFGILCLDGRLDVCRIGDTKIIAYPGSNDFDKSTGRQFVTLQLINDGVNLSFNEFSDVRSQIFQLNHIRTLLVMTDGISNQMEAWLKGRDDLNFSDKNTREIFARFKQKTYDDKALCIIQVKG